MLAKISAVMAGLGPGLLYAGAAVGVSHLVMSTKAGANYEFLFLLLIPIIHLIKYPFYKFGPQYTALTGRSILHGYFRLGRWALAIYMVMTILSMCLIQSAVTIVTSSLAIHFFGLSISHDYLPHVPAVMTLLAAAAILYVGKYSLLDRVMKVIIIVLTLTTLTSLSMVLVNSVESSSQHNAFVFSLLEYSDLIFLAAFIGWMPAPMDVSVWHSVWSEEANRSRGKCLPMRQVMLDFRIGYFGTALLAMAFLSLGALVMYGSGEAMSANGATFAGQLVTLYTDTLGSWAYPVIGVAALATMFSTTLTCLDAYPRTLEESYFIWKGQGDYDCRKQSTKFVYRLCLTVAVLGTISVFLLIKNVSGAMGFIVTVATVVSFISAPVFAYLNYKVIHSEEINDTDKPGLWMKRWSYAGLSLMAIFSLVYLMLLVYR